MICYHTAPWLKLYKEIPRQIQSERKSQKTKTKFKNTNPFVRPTNWVKTLMETSLSLLLFSFFFFIIIIVNKINGLRSSPASKNKVIDHHVISHSHGPKFPQGSLGWPVLGETIEFVSSAYSNHPESFMDKRRLL